MNTAQHISDDGDLRRYFSQIPHIADDDLDPYQYRLYGHYKRVCGSTDRECKEYTSTTAKLTKMSLSKVKSTRKWLAENGWIDLDTRGESGEERVHIRILDRWQENFNRYAPQLLENGGVVTRKPSPRHQKTTEEEPYKEKLNKKKNGGGNSSIATDNPSPVPSPTAAAVSKDLTAIIKALQDINKTLDNPFTGVEDLARTLLRNGKTPDDVAHLWNAMQYKRNPAGAFMDAIKRNYTPKTTPAPKPKYTPQEGEERTANGIKQVFKRGKWYDAYKVSGGNE